QFDWDCWSFDFGCDNNTILIANEEHKSPRNGLSEIYRSTDMGNTFTSTIQQPEPYFSGSISSAAPATYVQTLEQGVLRSLDNGGLWKSIGGPSDTFDTRQIVAVSSNIVFASDNDGNVWRTINSGGDSVAQSSRNVIVASPQSLFTTDTLRLCDVPLTHTLMFSMAGCMADTTSKVTSMT